MKTRSLCFPIFALVLFFTACQEDTPEASVADLYGTWVDTTEMGGDYFTVRELTFKSYKKFTLRRSTYGLTLMGESVPALEPASWLEMAGDVTLIDGVLNFYSKTTSYQDVYYHGDVVTETVYQQILNDCTYTLLNNGKELHLNYFTFPLDSPVPTEATMVKKD